MAQRLQKQKPVPIFHKLLAHLPNLCYNIRPLKTETHSETLSKTETLIRNSFEILCETLIETYSKEVHYSVKMLATHSDYVYIIY